MKSYLAHHHLPYHKPAKQKDSPIRVWQSLSVRVRQENTLEQTRSTINVIRFGL